MIDITGKTKLTGLIGSPVSHSISPQMHNEAFRQLGLDYVYLAFDVSPDSLKTAVDGLKSIGISGFNVTMPLKTAILPLMDELTPAAQIAGACNTVINNGGKLTGHTTDGTGFMHAVSDAGYDIIGKSMVLLGAGGAATAICAQAALDGVKRIDIFEQNIAPFFDKALQFAEKVRQHTNCAVSVYDINDHQALGKSISECEILTNATSVGMSPNTDACLIPDASMLRPELIVCDIIYNPMETKLYKMAKSAGCPTFNGLYMLLFQGAASFRCWTGHNMPVEAIREKYFRI